jgi:hypothetical protein
MKAKHKKVLQSIFATPVSPSIIWGSVENFSRREFGLFLDVIMQRVCKIAPKLKVYPRF